MVILLHSPRWTRDPKQENSQWQTSPSLPRARRRCGNSPHRSPMPLPSVALLRGSLPRTPGTTRPRRVPARPTQPVSSMRTHSARSSARRRPVPRPSPGPMSPWRRPPAGPRSPTRIARRTRAASAATPQTERSSPSPSPTPPCGSPHTRATLSSPRSRPKLTV